MNLDKNKKENNSSPTLKESLWVLALCTLASGVFIVGSSYVVNLLFELNC